MRARRCSSMEGSSPCARRLSAGTSHGLTQWGQSALVDSSTQECDGRGSPPSSR